MSVPKSKVLSVSKGLMALADLKSGCASTTNSQNVFVNVTPAHHVKANVDQDSTPTKTRNAIVDGEELSDVVIVEPTKVHYDDQEVNPYENLPAPKPTKTRELSSVEDIRNDFNQLQALVKQKEDIAKALSIMLNLVENNPLIVNKFIIAPADILTELIKLLTSADEVKLNYALDQDVGCTCGAVKYLPIDKIYIVKDGATQVLKYSYPDCIKLLDDHHISYKLVCNDA